MILRVFRATIHEGKVAAFADFFNTIAIPELKKTAGLVSFAVGKPRAETPNQFCMTMVWKDEAAIEAFVGGNWREARIDPEEKDLIASSSVEHYDLMGGSLDA